MPQALKTRARCTAVPLSETQTQAQKRGRSGIEFSRRDASRCSRRGLRSRSRCAAPGLRHRHGSHGLGRQVTRHSGSDPVVACLAELVSTPASPWASTPSRHGRGHARKHVCPNQKARSRAGGVRVGSRTPATGNAACPPSDVPAESDTTGAASAVICAPRIARGSKLLGALISLDTGCRYGSTQARCLTHNPLNRAMRE